MPRLGKPVRGSTTGRPVMALLDLLGRRWTLRVIWELRDGSQTFRSLRERCGGISPSVLNRRLAELREVHLVETGGAGYALTANGRSLLEIFEPVNRWAEEWTRALRSQRSRR